MEANALPALNGVRGVASFIVMIYHGMAAYGPGVWYGYGVENHHGIHQLPFIRALFDGSSMVFLFYILSGFLLSLKPLALIKAQRWDDAFHALGSSAFRRPLRLFLPALVTTAAVMVLHWAGLFEHVASLSALPDGRRLTRFELPAPGFESFQDQLGDWWAESLTMMNPFSWDRRYNPYNAHLWTLTAELRASMIGFLALLITARLTTAVRVVLICATAFLFAQHQRWEVATMLSGILLAETHLSAPIKVEPRAHRNHSHWRALLIFLLGIYLLSYPKLAGAQTPGFRALTALLTPPGLVPSKFFKSAGAWLVLWSVTTGNCRQATWLFTTRPSQYIGRVSTGIYMTHGPLFHSLGLFLMTNTGRYTGRDTAMQKTASFAASAAVMIPAVMIAAEGFCFLAERPCQRFVRWLERRVVAVVRPGVRRVGVEGKRGDNLKGGGVGIHDGNWKELNLKRWTEKAE